MKIGCCIGWKNADAIRNAKELGYDYMECGVNSFVGATPEQVAEFAAATREIGLPCPAANCLFPGGYTLTGPDADFAKARDYLEQTFELIDPLHLERVVFGSGGARRVPEGWSHEKATEQLVAFCSDHIVPVMKKHNVVCVLEELNKKECNIVNSAKEAMDIVRAVESPWLRLLIDLYHTDMEQEPVESFADYAGYIAHCHIASAKNARAFPCEGDGENYKLFFDTLRKANYQEERISIEGNAGGDFDGNSRKALALLKTL